MNKAATRIVWYIISVATVYFVLQITYPIIAGQH